MEEWIKVTESLPNIEGQECLVTMNYFDKYDYKQVIDVRLATWQSNQFRWSKNGAYLTDKVTAWMPLPEPYQE